MFNACHVSKKNGKFTVLGKGTKEEMKTLCKKFADKYKQIGEVQEEMEGELFQLVEPELCAETPQETGVIVVNELMFDDIDEQFFK